MNMPPCPVCRNTATLHYAAARDYEYFSTPDTYQYYSCPRCDCLFIHPLPLEALSRIYPPNYYSFVNGKKGFVVRVKEWLDRRFFRGLLRGLQAEELHVLDVGGGTGWLASLIRNMDRRVTVTQIVDIDAGAGEAARAAGHRYHEGGLETFETGERYHLILMLNLIEHVADPKAVMEAAGRLLAPGGILLVKTPNVRCWERRLFRESYWGGLHCPRHWVLFSAPSFYRIVEGTGLQVSRLQYTQGAPFWAFSIIAALHRKGWVRLSAQKPLIYHFLFPPISGLFAAIDFVRGLFTKTAQMFIVLKPRDGHR